MILTASKRLARRLVLLWACLLLANCGASPPQGTPGGSGGVQFIPPETPGQVCLPYGYQGPPPRTDTVPPLATATPPWWATPAPLTPGATVPPDATPRPSRTPLPPTCSPRAGQPTITPLPTVMPTTQVGPYFPGGIGHFNLSAQLGYDVGGDVALSDTGQGYAGWAWWVEEFKNEGTAWYATGTTTAWTVRRTFGQAYGKHGTPSVATGPHGAVYVAYGEKMGGESFVRLAASTDGGYTWGEPETLGAAKSAFPKVRVDPAGVVHVLYRQSVCTQVPGDEDEMELVCDAYQMYREGRSGGPWSAPSRPLPVGDKQLYTEMTFATLPDGTIRTIAIIEAHGYGVYAVYKDDAGAWSAPVTLRNMQGEAKKEPQFPDAITFPHNGVTYVYACWERYALSGIECAYSTDFGATWTYREVVPLGAGGERDWIGSPALVYDYETLSLWCLYVHVTWGGTGGPHKGFVGVLGGAPDATEWRPVVPSAEEVVVLQANSQQARRAFVGWRLGATMVPVFWEENINPPYGAYNIDMFLGWVKTSYFSPTVYPPPTVTVPPVP